MKAMNSKYIPEIFNTHMREILRKYWDRKMSLGINSSGDYPDLKNYDISEGNIKCEECTRQLWNDMTKKTVIERTAPFNPVIGQNLQ